MYVLHLDFTLPMYVLHLDVHSNEDFGENNSLQVN